LQRNVRPFDSRMYETDSTSLARFRDRLIVHSLLLQTLAFQVEILAAHVPLGS